MTKEKLQKALDLMISRREELLASYVSAIETPVWDNAHSMVGVETAGRLHDCDRHITNLQLELKRLETTNAS